MCSRSKSVKAVQKAFLIRLSERDTYRNWLTVGKPMLQGDQPD